MEGVCWKAMKSKDASSILRGKIRLKRALKIITLIHKNGTSIQQRFYNARMVVTSSNIHVYFWSHDPTNVLNNSHLLQKECEENNNWYQGSSSTFGLGN